MKKTENRLNQIIKQLLRISYMYLEMRHPCKLKHNLNRKNQVIILMITN